MTNNDNLFIMFFYIPRPILVFALITAHVLRFFTAAMILVVTSAGDPIINEAFFMLFNSHVISASSTSDGESTPITC